MLAAVIKLEPDWLGVPAGTPAGVQNALRLCLAKDAKRRVRDVGDVRLAIEGEFETAVAASSAGSSSRGSRWRTGRWIGALIVVALVTGVAVWSAMRGGASGAPVSRFALSPPPSVRLANQGGFDVVISPDGTTIAYLGEPVGGETSIYTRAIDELAAKPIPGTLSLWP